MLQNVNNLQSVAQTLSVRTLLQRSITIVDYTVRAILQNCCALNLTPALLQHNKYLDVLIKINETFLLFKSHSCKRVKENRITIIKLCNDY